VVGTALEVYNILGRGMSEPIYQEAFAIELDLRGMVAEREKQLNLTYKGKALKKTYFADFYYNGIVIELKSVEMVNSDHRSQLFNYLRMSKQKIGILINFGEKSLRCERYIYSEEKDRFILLTQNNYKAYIMRVS